MVHLPAVPDASEVEAGGWFKTRSLGGKKKPKKPVDIKLTSPGWKLAQITPGYKALTHGGQAWLGGSSSILCSWSVSIAHHCPWCLLLCAESSVVG